MIQNIDNKKLRPTFKGRIDGCMPGSALRDWKVVTESVKFNNLVSSPEQDQLIKNILTEMNLRRSKIVLTDELRAKAKELFAVMEKIIGKSIPFDDAEDRIFMKVVKKNNGELKGLSYWKYFSPQDGECANVRYSLSSKPLYGSDI